MLGGGGNKPDSISNYALFILKAKLCTGRFRLENLGEAVCTDIIRIKWLIAAK